MEKLQFQWARGTSSCYGSGGGRTARGENIRAPARELDTLQQSGRDGPMANKCSDACSHLVISTGNMCNYFMKMYSSRLSYRCHLDRMVVVVELLGGSI